MNFKFLFVLIFAFLISCSEEVISEQKLVNVYKEILISREFAKDSIEAKAKIDSIFKSNNLTEKQFRDEILKLASDSKRFNILIDSVRNQIINMNKIN